MLTAMKSSNRHTLGHSHLKVLSSNLPDIQPALWWTEGRGCLAFSAVSQHWTEGEHYVTCSSIHRPEVALTGKHLCPQELTSVLWTKWECSDTD